MQPIKLIRERTLNRAWTPKGKVWFQKNDDSWNETKDFEHTLKHAEATVGAGEHNDEQHMKVKGYTFTGRGYRKDDDEASQVVSTEY